MVVKGEHECLMCLSSARKLKIITVENIDTVVKEVKELTKEEIRRKFPKLFTVMDTVGGEKISESIGGREGRADYTKPRGGALPGSGCKGKKGSTNERPANNKPGITR